MAYKSDVYTVFPKFKSMVEKYFKASLVTLYTDGGTEYKSLKSYFVSQGIQHQVSPPYTPEHVGSVERKHRHIVETCLAMLHKASLPLKYWSHAFLAAAYLINRLPTPVLKHQTPFESLFQQLPNYDKLRAFGCLCFPWLRSYSDHKLDKRSKPCVFIGYSNTHHAYKCLDLSSNRVYISHHVQFIEHQFPLVSNTSPTDLDQVVSTWSSCSPALAAIQPSFLWFPLPPNLSRTKDLLPLPHGLIRSCSHYVLLLVPVHLLHLQLLSRCVMLLQGMISPFPLHLFPCHHLSKPKGPLLHLSHLIEL